MQAPGTAQDPYFERVLALMGDPGLLAVTDPETEERIARMASQPADFVLPDVEISEEAWPGPHGPIPVRIYGRPGPELRPMLVWCHGGAWVAGDLEMHEADATARVVSADAGAVVVSVDYRLAVNGVHFPVPLDDVAAAYLHARTNAERLGADPARCSIGGASAGANLAAGAVVRLRAGGLPLPSAVLLVYPLVHPALPPLGDELASKVARLSPGMAFAPEVLRPIVENYLGAPAASASDEAMPGLAALHDLPPTLIVNSEHDALRASGELYGEALTAAGVHVEMHCAPDVLHGYLNHPWLPTTRSSLSHVARWVAHLPDAGSSGAV